MGFTFHVVDVLHPGDGFANIVPALPAGDDAQLALVNDVSDGLLDPICQNCVEYLGICVHQGYGWARRFLLG